MGLLLCKGDCCLCWSDGDLLEVLYRLCGLGELLAVRPRLAGDGERRLAAAMGDLASRPGLPECSIGLLLCLGGDEDDGGVRLLCEGELLRLGDLETRLLGPGEERFGDGDILLFGGGKGEGL